MTSATIKGTIIQGILHNIEKRHGPAGLSSLLQGFTPEELRLLHGLKTDSRISSAILCRLYDRIKQEWGQGRSEYYSGLMQDIAEQNINAFLKFLISFGLPSFVANSVANVYKYYFDYGQVIMVSNSRNSVEFYIKDGEPYGEALCAGIIGWGTKGLAMAGAVNIQVQHDECIHKGKARCYFKVRWD